jgi:hypothetical protein
MKSPRIPVARLSLQGVLLATVIVLLSVGDGQAQRGTFTKAVVGDHIKKVEDGVDQFRDYLEGRGEDAKNNSQSKGDAQAAQGRARANSGNTEARKEQAGRTKDELDDALGELNTSTNRLRRRFDGASNYMDTREQMEKVMESARRVNQVMTRGKYGTQAERYWAALRTNINDLARTYGLSPMGV